MNTATAKWMKPRKQVITAAIDTIIENVAIANRTTEVDEVAHLCVSKYVKFSVCGNSDISEGVYIKTVNAFKSEIIRRMRLMGEF